MPKQYWNIRMRATAGNRHISGAETITTLSGVEPLVQEFTKRAFSHERGEPDLISITVEKIKTPPVEIPALPVKTVHIRSPEEAETCIRRVLEHMGISRRAIETAFHVVQGWKVMRGAAVVTIDDGRRIEPDPDRGIRVSRLGMADDLTNIVEQTLKKAGMHPVVVREAITLASKVASCPGMVAELCISDDPSYTTGYIASKRYGYLRIPHIKHRGDQTGGRVFFIKSSVDPQGIFEYLEKTPVLITSPPEIGGIITFHELLNTTDS